jgi:hypothetical protein
MGAVGVFEVKKDAADEIAPAKGGRLSLCCTSLVTLIRL